MFTIKGILLRKRKWLLVVKVLAEFIVRPTVPSLRMVLVIYLVPLSTIGNRNLKPSQQLGLPIVSYDVTRSNITKRVLPWKPGRWFVS